MTANHKPYILGVTGGIASGKTTACEYLKSLGAQIVDADEISRSMTAPGGAALPEIRRVFGDNIFLEDGSLNRRMLGDVVFSDERARRALEQIIHPAVQKQMMDTVDRLNDSGAQVVVLNVPLLVESGMDALCDGYWVMMLETEKQILRVMNRDQMSREQAEARVKSQLSPEAKMKNASAVIWTHRPVEETRREIERLYKDLLRRLEN